VCGLHNDLAVDPGLCCGSAATIVRAVITKGSTWHIDESFVQIAGRWMYLFRAVDSSGQTVDFYLPETQDQEAAKCFLKRALANSDNRLPHVFARDRLRSYPAGIRELQQEGHLAPSCRHRFSNNRLNPITGTSSDACARCGGSAYGGNCIRADRWNRSRANNSQRSSSWDHQKEPAWAGMGVWRPPTCPLIKLPKDIRTRDIHITDDATLPTGPRFEGY